MTYLIWYLPFPVRVLHGWLGRVSFLFYEWSVPFSRIHRRLPKHGVTWNILPHLHDGGTLYALLHLPFPSGSLDSLQIFWDSFTIVNKLLRPCFTHFSFKTRSEPEPIPLAVTFSALTIRPPLWWQYHQLSEKRMRKITEVNFKSCAKPHFKPAQSNNINRNCFHCSPFLLRK